MVLDQLSKDFGSSSKEGYQIQFQYDRWYLTPLARAVERNHQEMQDLLERSGARADGNGKKKVAG